MAQPDRPAYQRSPLVAATALLVATVLIALSAMVVVPPFSMAMFPFAVASSELSPFLVLIDLVWCIAVSRLARGREWLRYPAMGMLVASSVLAVRPLTQFNRVARAASEQLNSTGGPTRYSLVAALRGLPASRDVAARTVRYAASDGTPLSMRLYSMGRKAARPTVVVVYGGAWRGGDASQCEDVSRALASRGFAVAAIDYRHAPRHRYPAQSDDVRRSVMLLRDSAAVWGLDPAHMAILGRSSGGHLAKLEAWTPGGVPLKAVIAIYAPQDLAEGYRDLPSPDPIDVRAVLRDFIGGTPAARPTEYRTASPSSLVRRGLPPILILFGGHDHIVKPSFGRATAAALRAVNVRVVSVELPWAEHGFDMAPAGLGSQLAFGVIVEFLDRELQHGF